MQIRPLLAAFISILIFICILVIDRQIPLKNPLLFVILIGSTGFSCGFVMRKEKYIHTFTLYFLMIGLIITGGIFFLSLSLPPPEIQPNTELEYPPEGGRVMFPRFGTGFFYFIYSIFATIFFIVMTPVIWISSFLGTKFSQYIIPEKLEEQTVNQERYCNACGEIVLQNYKFCVTCGHHREEDN